jgi:hypothetical protein
LASIFKFSSLSLSTLVTLLCITIIYIIMNEIAKFFMRRKNIYNKPIVPVKIFHNNTA